MDSMKTLDTSLPRSSPTRRTKQQSSELLQAFKAAALSVTQLYKTAAADEESGRSAHSAGYQEALGDLQRFLDERNIGLDDGEGWQVRQWAVQRSTAIAIEPDIEAEVDDGKRARSTSPPPGDTVRAERTSSPRPPTEELARSESMPPASLTSNSESTQTPPASVVTQRPDVFHFRSNPAGPSMQDIEMDRGDHAPTISSAITNSNLNPSAPIRLEVVSKPPRSSLIRHTNHNRERQPRSFNGLKRKASYLDYFDVPGTNDKDGWGGGKRGRPG